MLQKLSTYIFLKVGKHIWNFTIKNKVVCNENQLNMFEQNLSNFYSGE